MFDVVFGVGMTVILTLNISIILYTLPSVIMDCRKRVSAWFKMNKSLFV